MPKAGLPPHKTTDTMSFADATHFHPDPPLAQDFHERFTVMAKTGARKKLPKEVAIINADNCTGCEACLEVCPVDCIYKVPGSTISVLQTWLSLIHI